MLATGRRPARPAGEGGAGGPGAVVGAGTGPASTSCASRGVMSSTTTRRSAGSPNALEAAGFATRRGAKLVPTAAGRAAHAVWARSRAGQRRVGRRRPRVPDLPAAQPRADPPVPRLAGAAPAPATRRATRRIRLVGRRPPRAARRTGRPGPAPARAAPSLGSLRTAPVCATHAAGSRRGRRDVVRVAAVRLVPHGVDAPARGPAVRDGCGARRRAGVDDSSGPGAGESAPSPTQPGRASSGCASSPRRPRRAARRGRTACRRARSRPRRDRGRGRWPTRTRP